MNARVAQKPIEWPVDGQNMYSNEQMAHIEVVAEVYYIVPCLSLTLRT